MNRRITTFPGAGLELACSIIAAALVGEMATACAIPPDLPGQTLGVLRFLAAVVGSFAPTNPASVAIALALTSLTVGVSVRVGWGPKGVLVVRAFLTYFLFLLWGRHAPEGYATCRGTFLGSAVLYLGLPIVLAAVAAVVAKRSSRATSGSVVGEESTSPAATRTCPGCGTDFASDPLVCWKCGRELSPDDEVT
jgi:hypothetical protein